MQLNLFSLLMVFIVILASLVLHELGHGYAAYLLGDKTAKLNGRLTFNPLKHIDPFLTVLLPISMALIGAPVIGGAKPVPFDPNNIKWKDWGVSLVAIAGPFVNLMIAFIVFGVWAFIRPVSSSLVGQIMSLAISINLGLFVFNMIPFPPLDGSRVLYALAPEFFRTIMMKIESFGIWPFFILFLLANSAILKFISYVMNEIIGIFTAIFIG